MFLVFLNMCSDNDRLPQIIIFYFVIFIGCSFVNVVDLFVLTTLKISGNA